MAKLFGVSRAELWRWKLMAQLPEDLVDRLLANGVRSTKALAAVALALRTDEVTSEVEKCPHCGFILRVRRSVSAKVVKVVSDWLTAKVEAAS